ncbi:MAG: hypothetical protein AAF530_11985 [Pseudomonadota bacterium]
MSENYAAAWAKPSLVTRIAVGKGVGFVVGLIGFFTLPLFWPEADWLLRLGLLLWYTTVGAIIGVFGVFTYHPVLRLPLPWWFRAPMIGAWMNFVLAFFAYDQMQALLVNIFGPDGLVTSPFWFTIEGALVGLLIGYLCTRFGGEGRESVPA